MPQSYRCIAVVESQKGFIIGGVRRAAPLNHCEYIFQHPMYVLARPNLWAHHLNHERRAINGLSKLFRRYKVTLGEQFHEDDIEA